MAKLKIVNRQTSDGETEKIFQEVNCKVYNLLCDIVIVYNEPDGMRGQVTVEHKRDTLTIRRTNSGFDSELIFEENKRRRGKYNTPYGEIELETLTQKIRRYSKGDKQLLEIRYELYSGCVLQSKNELLMEIIPEETDV